MALYKEGTCAVTSGAPEVIGTGTAFLANVRVGDSFKINGENAIYSVISVDYDNQLKISPNYAGADKSSVTYQIMSLGSRTPNMGLAEITVGLRDWPFWMTNEVIRKIDAGMSVPVGVGAGTGVENVAVGATSLSKTACTSPGNTAIGYNVLSNLTGNTCYYNTAIGHSAGSLTGSLANVTGANYSIFIGKNARAGGPTNTNEIVIGYGAVGNGSNTVTIGNSSTVYSYLSGIAAVKGLQNLNTVSSGGTGQQVRFIAKETTTNWQKAATITFGAGAYRGITLYAVVRQGFYNNTLTNSADLKNCRFKINMMRSTAVDLDTERAVLVGTSTDYVRVVKTQAGDAVTNTVYELQYRQPAAYKDVEIEFDVTSAGSATIAWQSGSVDGSTTGTVYTPTATLNSDEFIFGLNNNVLIGTSTDNGSGAKLQTTTGIHLGNTNVSNGNVLDWYEENTFTATASAGFTTTPTATWSFTRAGNTIILNLVAISGTSNATTFTVSGIPTQARPATQKAVMVRVQDNGGAYMSAIMLINTDGTATVYKDMNTGAFTASGTKGIGALSISYTLV